MNYLGNLLQTRRFPSTQSGLLQGNTFRGQPMGVSPIRGMAAQQAALPLTSGSMYQAPLPTPPSIGQRVSSGLGGVARGIGGAFTGEGSSARLNALAASLLQGPSRTPISLGPSLAQGLLAGNIAAQQEEDRRFKRGLLEQETSLAKQRLDLERQKLSPTGEIRTGFGVVYDSEGNEKQVEKIKDSLGNISYRDVSTKADIDFTQYSLNKPEATSTDFGTPKLYINKDTGESEYIVEITTDGVSSLARQLPDGSFEDISLTNYKEPISEAEKVAAIPNATQIYDFAEDAMKTQSSAASSLSFISDLDRAVESKNFGLKGLLNNFTAKFKSATGQDLTEEEALRRLLSSKQAGIVGSSRVEILGPGVLSNQDIEFLFNAVGGKIDSLISDPRLMRDLLLENYRKKMNSYKFQSQKYNANKQYLAEGGQPTLSPSFILRGKVFNGFIDPDYFTQGGDTIAFMNMTPEDQQKVLIGFQ